MTTTDPHRHQPVLHEGPALADARLVAILIHGRGASAEDILGLAREFRTPGITYLAPQAAGHTWYPFSFLSPLAQNEPGLTSALGVVGRLVAEVQAQGVPSERIVLMGFSQGACLTLEFTARHPAPYAVVAAFSGGLIGPPGTPRDYPGTLTGARVFLGCSDVDAHIPVARVRESAEVFRRLGATVDERIYPQMGHTVNRDELSAVDAWLTAAAGAAET